MHQAAHKRGIKWPARTAKTAQIWETGKKTLIFLALFMLVGALLRVLFCFWGYPEHLHPDEPTIVVGATNMLSRHSFEPNVYNRPDHFEIKCCALLFAIYSKLRYGLTANTAYLRHAMDFYLIARLFTAFWGVMMIPLIYRVAEAIKERSGLIAAGITALLPIFLQHSAYATPDIVLTFFVLLIGWLSLRYLQAPSRRQLVYLCLATAIGITIKYTCAISCLWIATVVIVRCVRERRYLDIIKDGAFCVAILFAACFFMAPNLFTNFSQTVATFKNEARSVHVGADGLGFFGNLFYYPTTFFGYVGWEALPFLLLGAADAIRRRGQERAVLLLGALFWVCTSALPLHWERWGMPMYAFFVILIAAGVRCAFMWAARARSRLPRLLPQALCALLLLNLLLSDGFALQNALTREARLDAVAFCQQNGISEKNAVFDGYTPLKLRDPATLSLPLDGKGRPILPGNKRYVILSSAMYSRYDAAPERYPQEKAMYDAIRSEGTLLYCAGEMDGEAMFGGAGNYYPRKPFACYNAVYAAYRLCTHRAGDLSGPVIRIYQMP